MMSLKNLNYYPFERNNYFYGKLLTVADFELEQKYMNDKRRFLNKFLFGTGVICGLNSYGVDDTSIMIESGAALDSTGREIILNESVIRKLSGIDGFEATTGNTLYLCMEYKEVYSDSVYSIAHTTGDVTNNNSDYNRIKENYRLYLTEKEVDKLPENLLDKYITSKVLYTDKYVTIIQSVPNTVCAKSPFEVKIEITKKLPCNNLSFDYIINTPYFDTVDGTNSFNVCFDDSKTAVVDSYSMKFTLHPRTSIQAESAITVDAKSFRLTINNEDHSLEQDTVFNISVSPNDIFEIIDSKYFSSAMDSSASGIEDNKIFLAKIEIFRSSTAYIIESVQAMPFKQYINNPQISRLRTAIEEYFPSLNNTYLNSSDKFITKQQQNVTSNNNTPELLSSSGVIEIPLGFNPRPKQRFFSEEIMHGLGKGNVTIVLGTETSATMDKLTRGNQTLFGNPEIFRGSDFDTGLPQIELASINYEERGTFVIGVKLVDARNSLSVKIKWHAFKDLSASNIAFTQNASSCLFIKPDTIVISPRETAYFKPIFYNTEESPCKWTVVDESGGKIEPNGVYTAPSKEGVYELRAESISDSSLKASAFVVVKEKGDS